MILLLLLLLVSYPSPLSSLHGWHNTLPWDDRYCSAVKCCVASRILLLHRHSLNSLNFSS